MSEKKPGAHPQFPEGAETFKPATPSEESLYLDQLEKKASGIGEQQTYPKPKALSDSHPKFPKGAKKFKQHPPTPESQALDALEQIASGEHGEVQRYGSDAEKGRLVPLGSSNNPATPVVKTEDPKRDYEGYVNKVDTPKIEM